MSKRVTVIVEGREYIVEVGDLSESPIKATVNKRTYQVEVPGRSPAGSPSPDEAATSWDVPPAAAAQAARKETPSVPVSNSAVTAPIPAKSSVTAPIPAKSSVTAPIPGNIIEVKVKAGDVVKPGDVVCVLEAMKMNNLIRTNHYGLIASVDVIPGQAVDYGDVLVTFE